MINSSWAISHVDVELETDVSETSVSIIKVDLDQY
jgi:hypothetical protein